MKEQDALVETASRSLVVTEADTARAWGSEFPLAASTPFVLGLAETACHDLMAPLLEVTELTVGVEATIRHLAPSPVGATLVATASVVTRSGRRADFSVLVRDGEQVIAEVQHSRAVVPKRVIEDRLCSS